MRGASSAPTDPPVRGLVVPAHMNSMIAFHNLPAHSAEEGYILIRVEEASPETRGYSFIDRQGRHSHLRIRAGYLSRVESMLVTADCVVRKESFIEQELRLAHPYTGWDAHKRLAWYAAKHFLETNEQLGKDTSRLDQITSLREEAERIQKKIDNLKMLERERYEDVPNPMIPESANI